MSKTFNGDIAIKSYSESFLVVECFDFDFWTGESDSRNYLRQ